MNISIRVLRNQSSYILLGLPEIRIKKKVVIRSLIINFENYNPITLQPAYKSYKNSGENWNGKKKNNKTASLLHFKNHIASIIIKLNNSIRMWKKAILSFKIHTYFYSKQFYYVRTNRTQKHRFHDPKNYALKATSHSHTCLNVVRLCTYIYIKAYFSRISP